MDNTALFNFSYGLYVLGVKSGSGFGGSVVDAIAQLTSDASPIILVNCMKANQTPALIKETGEFTISILSENVDPFVIANFGFQSGKTADKWANVPHTVKDGLPILEGAVAYVRARVKEVKELSTHTAFFCEVVDAWNAETPGLPLIYGDYQRRLKGAASAAFTKFKETGAAPAAAAKGAKWECAVCGYVYDGEIPFEQLPADWTCPLCGVGKEQFKRV